MMRLVLVLFVLQSLCQASARVAFNKDNGGLHHHHAQVDNSLQNSEEELLEQILDEIQKQPPGHIHTESVGVDEDMEELLDEIYNPHGKTSVEDEDLEVMLPEEERDLDLINALNSLESILSINPDHDQFSMKRRRRSAEQDQKLLDAMDAIESLLYSSNIRSRRSIHEEYNEESQTIEAEHSDDLLDALGSLESLMRATTHSSRKRRSLPETHDGFLYEEILVIYQLINKAEMKIGYDSKAARNLLETVKMKLKIIAKYHREHQETLSKVVKRSAEDMMEVGPIEAMTKKMVARGYNSQEYHWLSREFDLTKEDVDEVKNLSDQEFIQFSRSLKESVQPMKKYPVEELLKVFKSGRQLVPAELEAAAHGVVHVGRHLGGRARVAVDPVVSLVRDTVIPGAEKLVDQAVDTVPEDVKDWVGEGGKIAARRVEMVVEYVGPKLSQFSDKINEVQDELSETAGEAVSSILPALQGVLEELKDTLDVARDVLPPVRAQAASLYNSVRDTVKPTVVTYTDKIRNDVAPTLKNVLKSSLNAVFTGVPRVIKQLSHEAHDAAKVFSGNYQSTLKDLQNSQVISEKRKEKKKRDL